MLELEGAERERLERDIHQLHEKFRRVLKDMGIKYWQEKDAEKLLVLRQWARRTGVRVDEVMRILVEHYRRVTGKQGRRELGISISVLCGQKAGERLDELLKEARVEGVIQKATPWKGLYKNMRAYRLRMQELRRTRRRLERHWRRRAMRSIRGDRMGWWTRWNGRSRTDAILRADREGVEERKER